MVNTSDLEEVDYANDVIRDLELLKETENFSRVASGIRLVSATKEEVICELVLDTPHVNSKGSLHGGLTATLTDIITARTVRIQLNGMKTVSMELSVSYLLPVTLGDTLVIKATVLKCGKKVAFTEAEFRRKSDGKLVAKGKHTVAIVPPATTTTENNK